MIIIRPGHRPIIAPPGLAEDRLLRSPNNLFDHGTGRIRAPRGLSWKVVADRTAQRLEEKREQGAVEICIQRRTRSREIVNGSLGGLCRFQKSPFHPVRWSCARPLASASS